MGAIEENGEAEQLKQNAREIGETIERREALDEDTDDAFSKLCWMDALVVMFIRCHRSLEDNFEAWL